jgi:hypothetical protein
MKQQLFVRHTPLSHRTAMPTSDQLVQERKAINTRHTSERAT